jgi:misacylated tRNA(Ala) deacylase
MNELIFREDAYVRTLDATVIAHREFKWQDGAMTTALILDRTMCYPESGGQPGDHATLAWEGGSAQIIDSRKSREAGEGEGDVVLHLLAAGVSVPVVGVKVSIALDWARRYVHMRYHTMLHLVCAALPGIYATGNSIDTTKARIDFDLSGVELDRDATELRLNALIADAHGVETLWITDEELAGKPALVRTMSVAPPTGAGRVRLLKIGGDVDLQPCGGTHVKNTREIGPVKIVKVENKGKQNRRIVFQFA